MYRPVYGHLHAHVYVYVYSYMQNNTLYPVHAANEPNESWLLPNNTWFSKTQDITNLDLSTTEINFVTMKTALHCGLRIVLNKCGRACS